jgi:membrane-bound lytic murein transglycosylase A
LNVAVEKRRIKHQLPRLRIFDVLILGVTGLVGLFLLSSCAPPPPPRLVLTPVEFDELTDWNTDSHVDALIAFKRSCGRFNNLPDDKAVGPNGVAGTIADWRPICAAAVTVADKDASTFFETWFTPYLAKDNDNPEGLFTGYYEAEIRASWSRNAEHKVPIFRVPDDVVKVDLGSFRDEWKGKKLVGRVVNGRLEPLPDRSQIDAGALDGKGLELIWASDPVDVFFLHIQGSGRAVMDDGQILRLGYAGQNGHPYVAIGRDLIERGAIPREHMSMQAIRKWLNENPDKSPEVMALNPSYVFFRILEKEGPVGAQGVPLTPGRSLAVDLKFMPMGIPIWLDTTDPLETEKPLRRLVVAQDTGGAIKGPVRGDLFWGFGGEAAAKAGAMKQAGRYYLLLPKTVTRG